MIRPWGVAKKLSGISLLSMIERMIYYGVMKLASSSYFSVATDLEIW